MTLLILWLIGWPVLGLLLKVAYTRPHLDGITNGLTNALLLTPVIWLALKLLL